MEARSPALLSEERSPFKQSMTAFKANSCSEWLLIEWLSLSIDQIENRKNCASQGYFPHILGCSFQQHCCYQMAIHYFILVEPKLLGHLQMMTFSTYCHSISVLKLLSSSFSENDLLLIICYLFWNVVARVPSIPCLTALKSHFSSSFLINVLLRFSVFSSL